MNLTQKPSRTQWPQTHYVYVEKSGPFMQTAQKAWQELHSQASSVPGVRGAMALYQMKPEMVYRAGFLVESKPPSLPDGLNYIFFGGGAYEKFTYVGSYSKLPEVSGQVFDIVQKLAIPQRHDFYIENYVNNPQSTPEAELITEILIPTK